VQAQRDAVRRALEARPGERILDLGSGPGILACELAREVGPSGMVTAVDISPEMNAIAWRRATDAGLDGHVEIVAGDARALAFADACFDAAVSTQVIEYVDDVDGVIRELRRVLRPGGRLVLLDTDWNTLVWSGDDAPLGRVLEAWRGHAPHTRLPRTLGPRLRACGFDVDRIFAVTLLNTTYNEGTYSYNLAALIADFVRTNRAVDEAEVEAWLAEFAVQDGVGAYFFSLNRYGFHATVAPEPQLRDAQESFLDAGPAD
jgi:SAM-dependent methyltransferase